MAQVTLYVPDALARELKRQARKAGKSLSAFVADLAARSLARPRSSAGDELKSLYGSWSGEFPEIEDAPPEERDPL